MAATSTWAFWLQRAVIIFGSLGVAAQWAAIRYSERRDFLSPDAAEKKIAAIEKKQAPRRISGDQHVKLVTALLPFHGQQFSILCSCNDAESIQFAEDFLKVFSDAGWTHQLQNGADYANLIGGTVAGVYVVINGTPEGPSDTPAAVVLAGHLCQMGLIENGDAPCQPGSLAAPLRYSEKAPAGVIKLEILLRPAYPR